MRKNKNWQKYRLEEITQIIAGQSPKSDTYNFNKNGLPFYQGKTDFGYIFPSPKVWCSSPIKIVKKNDILLSVRAPVGPTNIANEKCCIGRGLCAIRANKDVDHKFLYYYFNFFENYIWENASGSIFQAITIDDIKNLEISVPIYDEQKRIVKIIETKLNTIEKAKKANNEQLSIIKKLFDSYVENIYKNKNWNKVKLGDIAIINPSTRGKIPDDNEMCVSFVPMTAVDAKTGTIKNVESKILSEVRKGYTYFENEDILFAKITPCMENGKSAIARNLQNEIGFGSTEFHVIKTKENILAEWLHYYIRRRKYLEDAKNYMTGSVGQQRLPDNYLYDTVIPLPPLNEQEKYVTMLNKKRDILYDICRKVEEQSAYINALSQSILRKAFNGEL